MSFTCVWLLTFLILPAPFSSRFLETHPKFPRNYFSFWEWGRGGQQLEFSSFLSFIMNESHYSSLASSMDVGLSVDWQRLNAREASLQRHRMLKLTPFIHLLGAGQCGGGGGGLRLAYKRNQWQRKRPKAPPRSPLGNKEQSGRQVLYKWPIKVMTFRPGTPELLKFFAFGLIPWLEVPCSLINGFPVCHYPCFAGSVLCYMTLSRCPPQLSP